MREISFEERLRRILLWGVRDVVDEIEAIERRLNGLGESEEDEVEEVVLTAFREVLIEELLEAIEYYNMISPQPGGSTSDKSFGGAS